MAAKFVLLQCQIVVNGVNFSDHTDNVEVVLSKKSVETTSFSGGGFEQIQGLREDYFTLNFQQDFSAAEVDATLYPLYNNGNEFLVTVNPTTGVNSPTNPQYSGTCILLDYTPLTGKVGSLSSTKVKFAAQRTGIVRATS